MKVKIFLLCLLLSLAYADMHAQQPVTISGSVTDENGEPLPGATVTHSSTTNKTLTDQQGLFKLLISSQTGTLEVSSIGYVTAVVELKNQNNIRIVLKETTTNLGEVVVVGYGTQKKVSLTSAVGQIKGEELLKRPVSNVVQALQGQLPGLTIRDLGGAPGKSNVVARVRGITTLSNNNPLVIVDGIEQPLANINPDDIETISVLKDASSTSIYGSRAANGVLLVTTKRAKSGKMLVSYNGFYALQKSINDPEHMGLEDYLRLQNVAYLNSGRTPRYTEAQITEYVNSTDRIKFPLPHTWFKTLYKTAPQTNHSLSLSGGNENIKSRISVRYQDQQGIIPNSNAKIGDVRINNDYKVSSKISVNTDLNYRNLNSLSTINDQVLFAHMLHGSLFTVPRYPDGTYGVSAQGNSPLIDAELAGYSKTQTEYITGNVKADYQIIKGLKFIAQIGVTNTSVIGKDYTNKYEVRDYYNPNMVKKIIPINRLTEARNYIREYTFNNLLTYSKRLGNHNLDLLGGFSQISNKANNLNAYRQGFYNNDVQSIGQGTNDNTKSNNGAGATFGLQSYFGRINYAFMDKYLLEINGRSDGSSRFVASNRYSFFPSFSAGWRISNEKFWSPVKNYVNELKLRGSYGKTGNQAVALYSYYQTLNLVSYTFSGLPVSGYTQQTLANSDLTWETTTQADIGVDAELFNSRLSMTVDYYNKRTDGILLTLPVPSVLGLNPSAQNAGIVDNKGWEFQVSSRNNFGAVSFTPSINLSINTNKVVSLAGTGPYINGADNLPRYITGEGYSINALWGYKTAGLFQTQAEVDAYPTLNPNSKPGDVKYIDLNKDGIINGNDMTFQGNTFPKYIFGSSMNVSYRNFNLSVLFQGAAKVSTRLAGAIPEMGNQEGFTSVIYTNNYWIPERPDARFPRPRKGDFRNVQSSDRTVLNGDYLRLKNLQFSYQLPASWVNKFYSQKASVYFSGTNLLTFSKLNEWGVDPEAPSGTLDYYPQTALYTLGINLQF
ncbi:MAG: SusC/RagA family TonB-linked outer membrane protein [Daejeonella sp.]